MKSLVSHRHTPLALALVSTLIGGMSAPAQAVTFDVAARLAVTATFSASDGTARAVNPRGPVYSEPNADGTQRYIVIFKEAPLAGYQGDTQGLSKIPLTQASNRPAHPDVNSTQALNYVAHLQAQQQRAIDEISESTGRSVAVARQFQHAINAVAMDLSADEAEQVKLRDDVLAVNREQVRKLHTYATPTFIGATSIWNGTSTPGNVASKGEGIVIGEIDSGINWVSNSFKATGSDGVAITNPLGTGVFKGNCVTGGRDAGHCNDKLIGIYNLESTTTSGQDLDGHGSHTASTAAGDFYNAAPYAGATFSLSGIAPHANVIAYLACGTTANSCLDTQLTAAANQVVADGIVDAVNYSIGGPTPSPWDDTIQLAFLGAENAGVFVATAAGNDGPTPATANENQAPWTTTVAATTPSMVPAFPFGLTSPAGAANTMNLAAIPGSTPYPTQAYTNLRLIESPTFADGSNDGCAAYPANYFRAGGVAAGAQGIAVLHLDQNASNCASGTRRTNAATAGAIAVIYVDPLFIGLGATGASYSVLMSDWNNIKATAGIDVTPTGNATGTIGFPISAGPRPSDNIAGFSSRGPIAFANLKPDISAPGDTILASLSPTATSGYNAANQAASSNIYGVESGTSMATPHITGSAALVRSVNRSWSPMEVKSALMTTAVPVLNEDNATLANPNVAGAGRVDLTKAAKAGLLFDESYDNFLAANPATGGKPETLNIASLYHPDCTSSCTFKRTVRSSGTTGTWTIAVTGDLPAGSFTLDKTSFLLGSSGMTSFTFNVNALNLTPGQWYYGQMTLTSSNPAVPVSHLPIAIRAASAKLRSDKSTLTASATAGSSTTQVVTVSNAGNPTLNWSFSTTTLAGTIVNRAESTNGLADRTIGAGTVIASTNASNSYGADYFDIASSGTTVTKLQMSGFNSAGTALSAIATQLAWRIFADGGNVPNGRPGVATDPQPVFTYQSAATAAGTTYAGDDVRLDIAAGGGTPPALASGRYWFSMAPTVASTSTANSWFWLMATIPGKAPPGQWAQPNSATAANKVYRATTLAAVGGPTFTGFAMKVDVNAACSASWLGYSAQNGTLGLNGTKAVTLTFDASALTPGTYTTYACLSGNGTSPPNIINSDTDSILIPVTFTVTAPGATSPTASALASPASAPITTQTLLTVSVTPGQNPTSSGVAVTANLSSIGGSSTQAFADDGQNGDVTAGDGTYSYLATVAANTTPGSKSLPVSVSDAQTRSASTTISLDVPTPTTLSLGSGSAVPSTVDIGSNVALTVAVTPGGLPTSSGVTVSADLTSIGGSATQTFNDNGDGTYSATAAIGSGTVPGTQSIPVSATDAQGRNASTSIGFTVSTPSALALSGGVANPGTADAGSDVALTVTVTPGATPASSGISVTGDLSAIGGSATQAFFDNGDGTFSVTATIDAQTTPGAKSLPISASDTQGRTATSTISLSIAAPSAIVANNASATPANVVAGATTHLSVAISGGAHPASSGLAVSADLSSIGGSATQAFVDNGDGTFGFDATVDSGTTPGVKLLQVTATDAQGRSTNTVIGLSVPTPGSPSGAGIASPNTALPGSGVLLMVAVTPGSNPTSTGVTVTVDLSSIGGSATQQFYDDGSNGDQTAGDNVFSFQATLDAGVPLNTTQTLPATITDAESRTGSAVILLNISSDRVFFDGFE